MSENKKKFLNVISTVIVFLNLALVVLKLVKTAAED